MHLLAIFSYVVKAYIMYESLNARNLSLSKLLLKKKTLKSGRHDASNLAPLRLLLATFT